MSDFEHLKALLETHPRAEIGSPAPDEEVDRLQQLLGPIPDDYRRFLLDVGWLEIGADSIFGFGRGVPEYLDLTRVAPSEWTEFGLPEAILPVFNDGGGNLTCIDRTHLHPTGIAPIVVWYHDSGECQAKCSSFTEWLLTLIPSA